VFDTQVGEPLFPEICCQSTSMTKATDARDDLGPVHTRFLSYSKNIVELVKDKSAKGVNLIAFAAKYPTNADITIQSPTFRKRKIS